MYHPMQPAYGPPPRTNRNGLVAAACIVSAGGLLAALLLLVLPLPPQQVGGLSGAVLCGNGTTAAAPLEFLTAVHAVTSTPEQRYYGQICEGAAVTRSVWAVVSSALALLLLLSIPLWRSRPAPRYYPGYPPGWRP
ncbi:hypothetical protein [Amycolatopsis sp. NPDC001319]|uniref:hypothetical protein n=2 Tax=unclassified Amycolatopsis TaxID=2618356 RepID=UPI0036A2A640